MSHEENAKMRLLAMLIGMHADVHEDASKEEIIDIGAAAARDNIVQSLGLQADLSFEQVLSAYDDFAKKNPAVYKSSPRSWVSSKHVSVPSVERDEPSEKNHKVDIWQELGIEKPDSIGR